MWEKTFPKPPEPNWEEIYTSENWELEIAPPETEVQHLYQPRQNHGRAYPRTNEDCARPCEHIRENCDGSRPEERQMTEQQVREETLIEMMEEHEPDYIDDYDKAEADLLDDIGFDAGPAADDDHFGFDDDHPVHDS